MAQQRMDMRKIKEVLRLKYGLKKSQREISQVCGIGKTTTLEYLRRARAAGLTWPLPEAITEAELEQKLFPKEPVKPKEKTPIPFQYIFEELKRPNVTLSVLWEEYKQANPNGYQYSCFCEQTRKYIGSVNYSMRQEHKAGEKAFLDFGDGLKIVDMITGKEILTEIFVFVWGASQKLYAEAVFSEDMASWIKVNNNALQSFGCCPKALVPDNLKAAVITANRYEPVLNRTYEDFSEHYGTVILPARSRKPRDKPLAENGVKLSKRWILARLRNKIFTSLEELNAAIRALLIVFNSKKMKRFGKSRDELFFALDKPNALPLPEKPYEYAQWKKAKVNINYHVSFQKHDYSVPYTYIHKEVEIKTTKDLLEVYFKGQRVCSHRISRIVNGYTTVKEHMPPSHQKHLEWTPERILEWSGKAGTHVRTLVEKIMATRRHPEQGYKSCLGIIRLKSTYSAEKINLACQRAVEYNALSYKGVKNILVNGMAERKPHALTVSRAPENHSNIRGSEYFRSCLTEAVNVNRTDLN